MPLISEAESGFAVPAPWAKADATNETRARKRMALDSFLIMDLGSPNTDLPVTISPKVAQSSTDKFSFYQRLLSEVQWDFARSTGAGGQNVNKVSTKSIGTFTIRASRALNDEQKLRLRSWIQEKAKRSYSALSDQIRIACQETRSQGKNRKIAEKGFENLFRSAFTPTKTRFKTKIPLGQKKKRLDNKKRRAEIKRGRGGLRGD